MTIDSLLSLCVALFLSLSKTWTPLSLFLSDTLTAFENASDESVSWLCGWCMVHHRRCRWQQERLIGKVIIAETRHGGAEQWIFNNSICIVVDARRRRRHVTFGAFGHVYNRVSARHSALMRRLYVAQCKLRHSNYAIVRTVGRIVQKIRQSKIYLQRAQYLRQGCGVSDSLV